MKRGRKPIPSGLNKLRGNPGQRQMNGLEPRPPAIIPDCPDFLDEEARAEWDRVAPQLLACGCLTSIDRSALAMYCLAWSYVVQLKEKVDEFGTVLADKNKGRVYRSPYFQNLGMAIAILHKFQAEFGMSPSSRTRIAVRDLEEQENVLEKFIAGGCTGN
jgi:P27 family predicted phage terminase small subunit